MSSWLATCAIFSTAVTSGLFAGPATPVDPRLPAYAPSAVVAGVIVCAGADSLDPLLDRWAKDFARWQPGVTLHIDRRAMLSADGVTALLGGRAQLAPFARELFPTEIARFERQSGHPPLLICVAGGSYATEHHTHAIAIYVNAANPLRRLTLAQLDAIFSPARRRGYPADLTTWGQLGLAGAWADRPVHLYGMIRRRASGNPPGIVNFLEQRVFLGGEFSARLREQTGAPGMTALAAIVRRVAADPDGIGYSGFADAQAGAKTVALAETPDGPAFAGTYAEVAAGAYPLSRRVYLCLNAAPSPLVREFLRFALSREGQADVAADPAGFLPLSAARAAAERAKFDCPAAAADAAPPYAPRAVAFPRSASYVTRDGAIAFIGYNDMDGILRRLDALFAQTHPGFKFALVLKGTRTAPPALALGRTALAPMGAPFLRTQLADYEKITGTPPLGFRLAHASLDPRAKSGPLALFVARDTPFGKLTLAQVARIFAAGGAGKNFTTWGDLGLTGAWAARPLHPCGLPAGSALGEFMLGKMRAAGFAPGFAALPESADVVARVGRDPLALGFAALNRATPAVKIVAVAATTAGPWQRGSAADIASGRYPYDRFLYLYARSPLDPFVREYLRLALSREGQAAIAADPRGYLPLNAREDAAELAKLDPQPAPPGSTPSASGFPP